LKRTLRNLRATRLPQSREPFGQGAHRASEAGVTLPKQLASAQPFYPREPFDARIEGTVGLLLVVKADGSIGDIRVTKPVESNLDEAAIGERTAMAV
jgi:outer membrane biosynthesis protein TonB